MPKKSSLKKATQVPQNNVVEEEKPSSTKMKKKAPSEIDEIFAGKKRKKSEPEKSGKPNEEATGNSKIKKKNKVKMSADGGFMDPPSRPRKKTNDGLAIYTEEELNISKADAGGTPLCPFDCSCCF
ncbi:uncharacterized protein C6G9.01c [Juglans microcarpa x Juglans regia]|uniref:uncharacterized protein C6G9.01c n=1 Tax=Juglans microcarpa x Juglans regia TaxID=2249226 RepID=UPI001B7F07DA|nr:uncharacterized protein C6G9.01c [Juglans microcarpa x Juglans regia]